MVQNQKDEYTPMVWHGVSDVPEEMKALMITTVFLPTYKAYKSKKVMEN